MNLTSISRMFLLALSVVPSMIFPVTAAGQSPAFSAPPRRVLQSVDSEDRVTLNGSTRPWVRKSMDDGVVSGSTPASHMLLLLQRSTQQQQALTEYLSDLQNPASPNYHHWLTPVQFAAAFGVNAEDVLAVTTWLQTEGFTINKVSSARNLIQFSGSVAQVQQAFQTQIHRLTLRGLYEMTGVAPVQIPRALAPVIKGLVNLDSARAHTSVTPGPGGSYDPTTHKIKPDLTLFGSSGPILYVDPSDAATIYDTPNAALNPSYSGTTLDGTGVTVGIVGDSNVNLTPVSLYRQAFLGETSSNANLPTVVVDGNDPGVNNDEIETFLDLEVLGGIAPKAKIYYYTSDESDLSDGLQNAIARAVDDNLVSILSISYGSCEADQGTTGNAFFSEIYQQAAAQGITVTVSSGDSGAANCDSSGATSAVNGLAVNGLASTPYNIAVGGTDYDVLGTEFSTYVDDTTSGVAPYWDTVKQYIPEKPWNDSTLVNTSAATNVPLAPGGVTNIIAGGGGVSSIYAKPAFQTTLTPLDGARDVPDVAFLAGNGLYGAVWVICQGGAAGNDCETTNGQFTSATTFSGAGGTSAGTPAFAGMLALLEQSTGSRLGQANNVLYQLASTKYSTIWHDVTSGDIAVVCANGSPDCGSNGFTTGYDAGTGYDLASGLGSVDAAAMIKNWASGVGSATSTTLTVNGSASPVTVAHGTSLTFDVAVAPGTATGDAALVANTTSLGGQLTIPLTNGAGSVSYNGLPGGDYTVYARYGGDTGNAASSSTPITVNIAKESSTTGVTINAYDASSGSNIASLNAIPYGSYIFTESTVYGTAEGQAASQGKATGTVSYTDNGASLGTAGLTSLGYASFPGLSAGVHPFTAGTHTITASFPGDASYEASTSAPVTFTVAKGVTQIQVIPTSLYTTSVRNDSIAVDIVTTGLGSTPTGTVTLQANGATIGTTTAIQNNLSSSGLVIGVATFNVAGNQLAPGQNTLTATYTGDGNYIGGTGNSPLTMSVATFALSTSGINVAAGSTSGDTATLRVTPLNDFTGVVNLSCAITVAPANATSPVTCSVPTSVNVTGLTPVTGALTANTTSSTTPGAYVITITGKDAATGKLTSSTTSAVTVTATTVTPAFALSNGGNLTIAPGASTGNTSVISVTPSGGFTGSVNLSCAVSSTPASANDPVTCSLSSPTLSVTGTGAVTATLTVNSTASTTAALVRGFGAGNTVLALVLMFIPACRRQRLASLACAFALFSVVGIVAGCGGGGNSSSGTGSTNPTPPASNPGTTAGSYVVTISATASNAAPASTTVNITVN